MVDRHYIAAREVAATHRRKAPPSLAHIPIRARSGGVPARSRPSPHRRASPIDQLACPAPADVPARSQAPCDRPVLRDDEEPAAWFRNRRRRFPAVPAGDDMDSIDWAASARLSTARGSDEFVVRERFAEEAPKVVIVCDRRPEMACFGPPLPWLDKPKAMRTVIELVLASAGAAGGFVGYLDYADGDPHWRQPKGDRKLIELRDERLWSTEYGGPADWLERSIDHLASHTRRGHSGDVRLPPLRLHPVALAGHVALGDRAPLGRGSHRDPGPDLGAELSRCRAGSSCRCGTAHRARVARAHATEGGSSRDARRTRRDGRRCSIRSAARRRSGRRDRRATGGHPRGVPGVDRPAPHAAGDRGVSR